jgi:hypothetical protein
MSNKTIVEEKVNTTFTLPNKKVKVIPVIKQGWLPKDHEASFLFKHATNRFSVPLNRTGQYISPLTDEETKVIESHPAMSLKSGDLSPYRKDGNFWKDFGGIKLDKSELNLDLSNPMDYITYKILLLQKDSIASSIPESKNKQTYKYAIVDIDFEDTTKSQTGNKIAEAMGLYSQMMNDRQKLIDTMFIISRNRVTSNAKLEFLQGQITEFALKNPVRFIEIMNDKDLATRILIEKAVSCKAIDRKGGTHKSSGGDLLGTDLQSTVDYLNDKANGTVRMIIEQQVQRAK